MKDMFVNWPVLFLSAGLMTSIALFALFERRIEANQVVLKHRADQIARLQWDRQAGTAAIDVAEVDSTAPSHPTELVHLRNEIKKLKRQIQERAANQSEISQGAIQTDAPQDPNGYPDLYENVAESHSDEYREQLNRAALKKGELRHVTSAVRRFARENDGRIPDGFEQTLEYLWEGQRVPEFDLYELVFQGNLNDIVNIPPGAVALVRQREIWNAPSGKPARLYGMLGGNIEIVESLDNFVSWEAQHIVPPLMVEDLSTD